MGLTDGLTNIKNGLANITTGQIVAGAIGTTAGVALGVGATALLSGSKSSKTRSSRSRAGRARDRKYISRQKHEQRYKRKKPGKYYKTKSRKRKGVKYTKNGQPYIIMSSGKARFIKRKGGKK